MMKFSAATNFDAKLIPFLKEAGVFEVFGKLPKDYVGGGRPANILPQVCSEDVSRHIKELHAEGIRFNYLLNATSLANKEFSDPGKKQILTLVEWLESIEVDSLTVTMPYLFQLIRKHYPQIPLYTSVFAGVNSPRKARFWEDLGAKKITLVSRELNRDFFMLREIRKSVECDLQLIANNACLLNCPMAFYHQNINTFASQENKKVKKNPIDYCVIYCNFQRFADKAGFLKCDWIRPEDVHFYEEIGINSLKLVDRSMPAESLARIVTAYAKGSYEGNLLDILHGHYKRMKPIQGEVRLKTKEEKPAVIIDNQKLEGFLGYFQEKDKGTNPEEDERHYQDYAKKALYVDPEYRKQMLKLLSKKNDQFFVSDQRGNGHGPDKK